MIYIYNPKRRWSDVGRLIAELGKLGQEAQHVRDPARIPDLNKTVSWGWGCPGAKMNASIVGNKLRELRKLSDAGVPVPDFTDRYADVQAYENQDEWYGRKLRHKSGNDLMARLRPNQAEYWVKKIDTVREFRIHVFNGKSVRTGLKVQQPLPPGVAPPVLPWIRSRTNGWHLSYGADCQAVIKNIHRDAAKEAVKALDYTFGAVDIGVTEDNEPVVFEVNTAPGLRDDKTGAVYAKHIVEFLNNVQG